MSEPVTIPDEALLDAAKALHEADKHDEWDDEGCNDNGGGSYTSCKDWTIHLTRAALEAAAPALREQFLTAAGLERTPVGITPDGVVIDEWRPGPALLAAERERIAQAITSRAEASLLPGWGRMQMVNLAASIARGES